MAVLQEAEGKKHAKLRRKLTLPFVVFCGLGVTVGAGIYVPIGEVIWRAGDHAPLAFLVAGLGSLLRDHRLWLSAGCRHIGRLRMGGRHICHDTVICI